MIKSIKKKVGAILPRKIKNILNFLYSYFLELGEARRLQKLYSGLVKKRDLVFDIGANKGSHTKIFLDLGCRIIAVEPNPELIPIIKKRFGKRVEVVNNGVGSRKSKMSFHIMKHSTHSTFLNLNNKKFNKNDFVKDIAVDIVTLKSLINLFGMPRLIKIDTEGYEYEVIKTLDKNIPFILFEFSRELVEVYTDVLNYLEERGYQFNLLPNISHKKYLNKLINAKQMAKIIKDENFQFGDILAINFN